MSSSGVPSSSQSSSSASSHPGQGVGATASASLPSNSETVLVSGEAGDSVQVQSQLASSHLPGDVTSKSNIGQVITDLGAAHTASSSWVDAESAKISNWGQGEIERILGRTKAMEEQLIAGAKEKQMALDASHAGELERLVRDLDLRKAAELKELQDGLQRQIQATLSTSKAEINRIESEMNKRKMDLLKQSQLKGAAEIDALSNLVVETKLVPSQTRTVIESQTNTGNVIAVATGGSIATGAAQADSYSSQKIAAVPNAGELRQASDLTRGDMIEDRTGRKVGDGHIINTQTGVTEQKQPEGAGGVAGQDVHVTARPMTNLSSGTGAGSSSQPIALAGSGGSGATTATTATTSSVAPSTGSSALARDIHSGATQREGQHVPIDHGREAGSKAGTAAVLHDGQKDAYDASGMTKSGGPRALAHSGHGGVDAAYGKHSGDSYSKHATARTGSSGSGEEFHRSDEGILGKVKHALGMEPTSTEASSRKM